MINKHPIELNRLELGKPFLGDVVDADDKIVFRRGLKLTRDLLAVWERRGSVPVFMMTTEADGSGRIPKGVISAHLAYDLHARSAVQAWFTEVRFELDCIVVALTGEDNLSLRPIEDVVERCLQLVEQDSALVVYESLATPIPAPGMESLTLRCSALAAISCVIGSELGLTREECLKVTMAGLLHDLSLIPPLLNRLQDAFDSDEEKQAVIVRHAYFTSDLLSARAGLQDLVRIIINQVHEQMDGSGYPRGMPGHLINSLARIINLADAFLSLIAVHSSKPGYVAGDAIAFLLHQTNRGVFDCNVMRAFLRSMTMYGIGAPVLLEDDRDAVVLRNIPHNPLQPIVVVAADAGTDKVETLDLEATGISIVGPTRDHRFANRGRLLRSQMDSLSWQEMHVIS